MKARTRTPEETYGPALEKARKALPLADPRKVATRAAVLYQDLDANGGRFEVPFFGSMYHVRWPDGSTAPAGGRGTVDISTHIILLHYLLSADGTPLASKWIAFRNLPGGLGYEGAFQGRAGLRLAHAFGSDQAPFSAAARALGGEPLDFGDASFMFRLLPLVWLAVVLHTADDEFPADANVLFDGATAHYLPTEDLAVLGGMLASRLIKTAKGAQRTR